MSDAYPTAVPQPFPKPSHGPDGGRIDVSYSGGA